MGLLDTVSMLETTTGFSEIESTEIPRPFSSQTLPHRFTDSWKVVLTSDSHFRSNRKWKYGGNHIVELATIDFLFDLNTMDGCIGHRFDAGNYFHFGEIESTEIPRPFTSQTLPHRFAESGSNL